MEEIFQQMQIRLETELLVLTEPRAPLGRVALPAAGLFGKCASMNVKNLPSQTAAACCNAATGPSGLKQTPASLFSNTAVPLAPVNEPLLRTKQ